MKAMILAAGRGERMRPLTDTVPKALLAAGGKPLIVWQIERLVRAGFRDIVVNHAHLGHLIEARLGAGDALGARIAYSIEHAALETAGGIAQALPLLGAMPFVAVNADVYCEFDYARLALRPGMPDGQSTAAHLVLVDNPQHHRQGDFLLAQDSRVSPTEGRTLTFSGIGAYHPRLFAGLAPGAKVKLATLLREAIAQGQVTGEHYRGLWIDTGTPERLAELRCLLD